MAVIDTFATVAAAVWVDRSSHHDFMPAGVSRRGRRSPKREKSSSFHLHKINDVI